MKAKPLRIGFDGYEECKTEEATHVELHLPGPMPTRIIPVITTGERRGTPCWTWNGRTDNPTLKPSILTKGRDETGELVCHTWITDGRAQFLDDSSHKFKGQTLDLLEVG